VVGRVRAAEAALLERLRRARPRQGVSVRPMVAALLRSRGRLKVAELARRAGLSTRQVERRFLDEAGLGAKAMARLVRFQSVLDAAGRGEPIEWAGVAFDGGYADQAHLIREFREFSGETPRTLAASQGRLSRQFTSPERLRGYFAAD
ncbi:MAG TPA: helix-turn-helix domain-containing protein, partial [Candidatus Polarisedimenticolia bacterium]|nr:helix-turn-helix domain-containing protein [Candidatus Polarisedimenticolia bacterium]